MWSSSSCCLAVRENVLGMVHQRARLGTVHSLNYRGLSTFPLVGIYLDPCGVKMRRGGVVIELQPAVLEASLDTAAEVEQRRWQVIRHREQRSERARYEADRAARQYQACEPEQRLVARTLERRWDETLQAVQQLEAEFDRFSRTQPRLLDEIDRERIRRLAGEAPA